MAPAEPAGRHLRFPADLQRLGEARAWGREQAAAAGFAGRELREVELALTEAVSNVIRHGYKSDPAGVLEVHAEIDDATLTLRIVDHAPAFDPTGGEPVDLSEPNAGGYGLYLIETVMDEVTWRRRTDGANELRLVRQRPIA